MTGTADLLGELMAAARRGDRAAYRSLLHAVTPYLRAIAAVSAIAWRRMAPIRRSVA